MGGEINGGDAQSIRADNVPYVDLTSYVSQEELESLGTYLESHLTFGDKVYLESGEIGVFTAKGYKHGDAIDLTDRDTSGWCADAFTAYTGSEDFKVCRAHRGDSKTWRLNPNARLLPGVVSFVRSLPFFEQTGKISIICNAPNSKGVEHFDIEFPDLVSEFVWVRPPSSKKKFYVRDPNTKEKKFVKGCIAWFDDHLVHNIEPDEDPFQLSIRIDGRFTPEFRELVCKQGTFEESEVFPEGSLKDFLSRQQDGPLFLQEVNEPPQYSSAEDSDEETSDQEE